MPPVRTTSKNTAFKPPRRISGNSNTSDPGAASSKATAPRPAAAAAAASKPSAASSSSRAAAFRPAAAAVTISDSDIDDIDDEDDLDDDEEEEDVDDSVHRRRSTNTQDASTAVPAPSQDAEDQPPIPPKLLNRLLHEGFEDEDMRIGKEAMAVAGKYVETFVREALARAMYEREEADREEGGGGDGFLQVSVNGIDYFVHAGILMREYFFLAGRGSGEACTAAAP